MLNFCTLFDKNYLSKGLALFDSLNRHCEFVTIYVLCLDDFTFNYLNENKINNTIAIHLSELEDFDKELLAIKHTRTIVEYYFTISPCFPLFLLKKNTELTWLCSLDADIYFYSNPQSIFNDFENKYSILITPHKFTKELVASEKYGIFNVSFQAFKNNKTGLGCLEKWRSQCIDWCNNVYDDENQRYADQKYLDTWPIDYPNEVKILDDSVSGLAVWNINNYVLEFDSNQLMSDGERLIFYHFHKLNVINKSWIQNGFKHYHVNENKYLDDSIYAPYINALFDFNEQLLIKKEKKLLNKNVFSRIINSRQLFFRFNNKLIRVDTSLILNGYIFLKKKLQRIKN